MVPIEFHFVAGLEGADGGEDVFRDLGVSLVVLNQDLEGLLFRVAVFTGFFVGEVFDDLKGGEFSGVSAFVRA